MAQGFFHFFFFSGGGGSDVLKGFVSTQGAVVGKKQDEEIASMV